MNTFRLATVGMLCLAALCPAAVQGGSGGAADGFARGKER